jgi:hypothetical protein
MSLVCGRDPQKNECELHVRLLECMAHTVDNASTAGVSLRLLNLCCYECGEVVSRDDVRYRPLGYAFLFLSRAHCLVPASGAWHLGPLFVASQYYQTANVPSTAISYNIIDCSAVHRLSVAGIESILTLSFNRHGSTLPPTIKDKKEPGSPNIQCSPPTYVLTDLTSRRICLSLRVHKQHTHRHLSQNWAPLASRTGILA